MAVPCLLRVGHRYIGPLCACRSISTNLDKGREDETHQVHGMNSEREQVILNVNEWRQLLIKLKRLKSILGLTCSSGSFNCTRNIPMIDLSYHLSILNCQVAWVWEIQMGEVFHIFHSCLCLWDPWYTILIFYWNPTHRFPNLRTLFIHWWSFGESQRISCQLLHTYLSVALMLWVIISLSNAAS